MEDLTDIIKLTNISRQKTELIESLEKENRKLKKEIEALKRRLEALK